MAGAAETAAVLATAGGSAVRAGAAAWAVMAAPVGLVARKEAATEAAARAAQAAAARGAVARGAVVREGATGQAHCGM